MVDQGILETTKLIMDVEKKMEIISRQKNGAMLTEIIDMLIDSTQELKSNVQKLYGVRHIVVEHLNVHCDRLIQLRNATAEGDFEPHEFLISSIESVIGKCDALLKRTMQVDVSGQYDTIFHRPKYADEIGNISLIELNEPTAIVIQGPIKYEDDFTLETVRLYRRLYSGCMIIVSTWDQESDYIPYLEDAGAIVCISSYPENNGYGNCALQAVSTMAGINLAIELGAEYICKTRTDERLYKADLFAYLNDLINMFPIKIDTIQEKRLITIGHFTMAHRLYNNSDLFTYGKAQDVKRYYDCPLDTRNNEVVDYVDAVQFAKLRYGEAWFTTHHIESLGFELKWTMEDSDYYRNNLFIILDTQMIDLYWPKYTNLEYRHKYDGEDKHEVTFFEWLHEQKIEDVL